MSKSLSHFGRQTVIYTIGNLVYRGASFLLIPLYVNVMPASEYGKLELLSVTTFLFQAVFSSGIAHSAMRFYFEHDNETERKRVVSTALLSSLAFSSLGTLLMLLFSPQLSSFAFGEPGYTFAFRLAAVTMTLEISREIGLSFLRARDQPVLFVLAAVAQLVTQVTTAYYTVAVRQMGMEGVLIANLVSTFAIWLVLVVIIFRHCGFTVELRVLPPMLKYGCPIMLGSLSLAGFQSFDRYILNAFTSLEGLGQYALALRIAMIVTALIITPFTTSYGPYRLSIMKQPDAKDIYARVLTYYTLVVGFVVAALAGVCREAVELFSRPEYWPAATIAPFVLASSALGGVDYCFQTGLLIQKKTQAVFTYSFLKGALRVGLLLLLIPRFGLLGAAWASVIGGFFGVCVTLWISHRVYVVDYEYVRLVKIALASLVVALAAISITIPNLWLAVGVKSCILLLQPILVLLLRCLSKEELQGLKSLWIQFTNKVRLRAAGSY